MKHTLVSVLMPVFNGEKYLRESIQSVLTQTYPTFELIIVNDNSTDGTEQIIHSFKDKRIHYLKNSKKLGLAGNRNAALKAAKGELIAILDADDIAQLTRLEKQVHEFTNNPELVCCGSWAEVIDESGNSKQFWKFPIDSNLLKAFFYVQFPIVHSSAMFRTKSLKKLQSGYNPEFAPAEDYDLCFRLLKIGQVHVIPEYLVKYRLHSNNTSSHFSQTISKTIPALFIREYQQIGLKLDSQLARNIAAFVNPQIKKKIPVLTTFSYLLEVVKTLRKKFSLTTTQTLTLSIYVTKALLLQLKNQLYLFLVNQKQPQA